MRADHDVLIICDYRGRGHAMETAAMLLECLAESGAGTFVTSRATSQPLGVRKKGRTGMSMVRGVIVQAR